MTRSVHGFPVIDVHVHIHPDRAETFLRIMDDNNLSRVVNLGILQARGIPFEEGMRVFRKVLGERMVYFCTPDFRDTSPGFGERMAEALARRVDGGARGLKIFKELGLRHKDAGGNLIPVDDRRLDPLWSKAGELGVPVLIHTADPVAFFEPLDENNERWEELQARPDWHFGAPQFPDHDTLLVQRDRVLERHPDTTFIGAHLGNHPENLAYVDACLAAYPNFYMDTCARIGEFGRHPVDEVRAFFIKHQERVLFGTDLVIGWSDADDRAPVDLARLKQSYDTHWRYFETEERGMAYPGYPMQGRWTVDAVGLPDEVLEKLYFRNAQRLIPEPGE